MTGETALDPTPQQQRQPCYAHPGNPATGHCLQCGRPLCDTCSFTTAFGPMCPDCMTAGPSAQERRSNLKTAIASLVLAVAAIGLWIAAMASSLLFEDHKDAESAAGVLATGTLVASLAGLTTGLIGRAHARRTGSPLALIGVIANSLLLVVWGVLAIVGLATKS